MSSRIAPPQASSRDQRKVYTDWANNRLKKAGFTDCQVIDLQKDITDGLCLPKIIQAVVQDTVPGITPVPTNDQERKQNIEACVRFLQCLGINCVGFTVKDVSEGSMRAILQLFFSLSHYKPKASGDTDMPPSRISRPTSPSLRMIHSVASRSVTGTNSLHSSPANSHHASPEPRTGSSLGLHASSAPGTAHLPPVASASAPSGPASPSIPHVSTSAPTTATATNSVPSDRPSGPVGGSTSLKHRPSQSRPHAGSGIPTGMDPMGQARRVPYRALAVTPRGPKIERQNSQESVEGAEPDSLKSPVLDVKAELKASSSADSSSIPPPSSGEGGSGAKPSGLHPPKSLSSGLKPPGGHSGLKPPSVLSSLSGKTEQEALKSKENSKTDLTATSSEGSSSSITTEDKEAVEKDSSSSSSSRLKFAHPASSIPSTGRSTPTLGSGLMRPSNRIPRSSEGGSGLRMPSSSGDKSGKHVRESSPNRQNQLETSSGSDQGEGSSKARPTDPSGSSNPGTSRSGIPARGGSLVRPHHEPSPLLSKSYALPDEPAPSSLSKLGDDDRKKGAIPRSSSTSASERRLVSKLPGNVSAGSRIRPPGSAGTHQAGREGGGIPGSGLAPPGDHPKKIPGGSRLGQLQRPTPRLSLGNLKASSPEEPANTDTKSLSTSALISPTGSDNGEISSNTRKTSNSKPNIPSPLVIDAASTGSPPATTDTCSSSSSISSISIGSANSQSESSLVDVQAPSPFGTRKYGQRTSPEGMSVEETSSPQDQDRKLSDLTHDNEIEKNKEALGFSSVKITEKVSDILTRSEGPGISGSLPLKEHPKRARSLSPKSSRRVHPLSGGGMPVVKASSGNLHPSPEHQITVATTGSEENITKNVKPMRSSLRSPHGSGNLSKSSGKKVTISPHSSIDSFGSSENSLVQSQEKVVERRSSQSERPKSMEELETHSFALNAYGNELDPHSSALTRHGSTRSTRSDRLDYSEVATFLKPGLQEIAQSRKEKQQQDDSTPELLETFENQLTNLRKDLESKDRMLSMYENSMADLNSTVHSLKRSLEAKEHAIKHLTEERNRFDYNPYDTRSLAPSRLAPSDIGGISDGAISDETESKEEVNPKKKKKLWKKILRKKKENDLPMNADLVSIAGSIGPGAGSKGLKRSHSRGKQDLMSISEYGGVDSRPLRMDDAKSLNLDARSEYGGYIPPFPENILTVYEEVGDGVSVMVELQPSYKSKENKDGKIILGSLKLQPDVSWVTMDNKICEIFKHHINSIDPEGYLGLTDESILRYYIGDLLRSIGNALLPHVTPYDVATSTHGSISIIMRGPAEESCDSLAYETLINAELLQTYIAMIVDTHWVVVMGTKGTCKTALADGLASHLELMIPGNETEDDEEHEEPASSCFKLSVAGGGLEIATKFIREEVPKKMKELSCTPILVLDGVYDANALEQIFLVSSSLQQRPYIIATLCSGGGGTRGIPLHQLMFHHNIRVITCNPQSEPALGILARFLRKKMYKLKANPESEIEPVAEQLISWLPLVLDHINYFIARFHSNSVALGPRVFMNCPLDSSPGEIEVWFLNLWNHFVIPYLMGTIMAGIETYTADPNLDWLDVREWVVDSYPWHQSHNIMKLRTLTPDDVGWNHAVRPQNRFMYLKDGTRIDDDTQSVLRMKPIDHLL